MSIPPEKKKKKNGNSCVENQISRQIKYQTKKNLLEILQTNIMLPTSIDFGPERITKNAIKCTNTSTVVDPFTFSSSGAGNLRIKKKVPN